MANDILFMEGFEFYADANDLARSWETVNNDVSITTGRSAFSSAAVQLYDQYADSLIRTPVFTANQTVYVGFGFRARNYGDGYWNNMSIIDFQYNGTSHVYVRAKDNTAYPGCMELYGPNGYIRNMGITLSDLEWGFLEFIITIDDTAGRVLFKCNGDTIFDLTNIDTKNDAASALVNQIEFAGARYNYITIDDLYVSDTQLYGDVSIGSMLPDAAGTNADWTPSAGSNYDCVNDSPFGSNTANYTESDVVGNKDTFSMADIAGVTDYHPVAARAVGLGERVNDLTARSVSLACLSSATLANGSAVSLPYNNQKYFSKIFQENPDGNTDWDWTTLHAAEFGYELEV